MVAAIAVIGIGWAIAATVFAAKCYYELYKWARQCQHARIAVAFKRKVQLQAPLVEWLMWCNQLDRDKDSHGRTVYRNGAVTVAITKAVIPPGKIRKAIRSVCPGAKKAAPKKGKVSIA